MTDLYNKVEQFVKESYGDKFGFVHFKRTVFWIEQLKPNADEALKIAGIAHDIERAFRDNEQHEKIKSLGFKDPDFLKVHQEDGAEIISKFLEENDADNKTIDRVKYLISKHEVGGDKDQNILKDADSISFFENNIDHFLNLHAKTPDKKKVKQKFEWMFNRISSEEAKKISKDWFEESLIKLDSV